jgi:peptidoglycan/LPS O-acetylase OafA/YrhL
MCHSASPFIGDNPRFAHEPLYFFALRGQLGVMLFFMISGYCIAAAAYGALTSGKPIWRYAFERVRRIYPPYLAALTLSAFTTLLIGYASAHHLIGPVHHPHVLGTSARYWIGNLFLLQYELNIVPMMGIFWSLCYEIAFYAVVGVWLWVAKLVTLRQGLAFGTLTLVLGVFLTTYLSLLSLILSGGAIFPFDLWHMFSLGCILFFLLEFNPMTVAGYSRRLRWCLYGAAAVAVSLTIVYIAIHRNDDIELGDPHSRIRSASSLLFFLLLSGLRRIDLRLTNSRWLRPVLWLGACSYSIYLVHPIVIPFASILCRKAGLDGNLFWIAFWIQVVFAVACGRVFYLLIERHFISSRQKKRLAEERAI